MKQFGIFQYVRDDKAIEGMKPIVLRSFAHGIAAHRLQFPESYKWVIRKPGFTDDPLDRIGTVGIKGDCESMPWYKGWLGMVKARIWLWRNHVAL